MCGIFGYAGSRSQKSKVKSQKLDKNAAQVVFEGLKRLEYRGYDSWGISIVTSDTRHVTRNKIIVEKHVGKIGNSKLDLSLITNHSSLALGHTRWATHGGVTKANAHPHLDCTGRIAIVHNGIVENFQEVKKSLSKNHKFVSETDTEVIAHLIEEQLKGRTLKEAVREAFLRLSGLNAVVVIADGELIAVKNGSPLVVGISKGENFIASDATAILPYTKRVIFLRDNQMAKVTKSEVSIFGASGGRKIASKTETLDWKVEEANLGKFKHFMLKEIYEQPKVIETIAANGKQIEELAGVVKRAHGTFFIGCGTASYAALAGAYIFSKVANKHVNFAIGSEFNYLEDYLDKESLVVAISQSGETIDVVEPVVRAKAKGASVAALTNVEGSNLWRLSGYKVLLAAGPERAVCATKSFSAMVASLIYLAYAVASKADAGRKILEETSGGVSKILESDYVVKIKNLAKRLRGVHDIYIIGRGISYATALEATLKLKEVPYLHSEGFAGGELKHGVIALVEKGTPCIVFAPLDETREAIISNAIEIKSRGGYIIGISPVPNEVFDFYLPVIDAKEASIIINTVPIQLLSYYLALEKGLDPDKPRNLAKSVTVK